MVFLHQVFGEHLAALDDGGVLSGAEAGNTLFLQRVHGAQHQRIVRRHHGIVNLFFYGKSDNSVNIRCAHIDAGGVPGDAAVAGQSKNFRDGRIFLQLADDGVFPSAAADNHNLHILSPYKKHG